MKDNKKILQEALRNFNRIARIDERVSYQMQLEEDGEDPAQDPNAQGGAPMPGGEAPMDGGPMGQDGAPMDGGMTMPGGDPNAQGGAPMPGGEAPMDGGPMGQDGAPMDGGMPMPGMEDPMAGGMPMPEEEDDVIDVDDITNAQEKTNSKVNKVGQKVEDMDDKFKSLMSQIDTLNQKLEASNSEIEKFKTEFEKRNPTPIEKLEQRAKSSFPFTTTVDEYWKNQTPDNYTTGGEDEEKVYEIDLDDIDEMDDKKIERSFMVPESYKYDIKRIFEE